MTRIKPTAILLGPSSHMVSAARAAGARSLVLTADLSRPAARAAALAADDFLVVDWRDHPRLLSAVSHFADSPLRNADGPLASVFGFGEAGALAAARANEALGLPGNPHAAVAYLTDKAALRDRVNQFAASPVRFERCDLAAALVPAAERVGFPCVVKPRTGSGGQDVCLLRDREQAEALARRLAPEPALIIEEYLDGPEYAVAAHSANGRHQVLSVMRKHVTAASELRPVSRRTAERPPPAGPIGIEEAHADDDTASRVMAFGWPQPRYDTGYELPAVLDDTSLRQIHDLVEATLTAAGHRAGPSQTELVLTRQGPKLIESHAHPGCERVSQLVALATGIDRYEQAIASSLRLPHPEIPLRDRHAASRLLPMGLRDLHDTAGAQAAREVPGVVSVEVGRHDPAATSRVAGHGVITVTGATPQEVFRALREAEDRLVPARASAQSEELSAV